MSEKRKEIKIYLSYSQKDILYANRMSENFQNYGVPCYIVPKEIDEESTCLLIISDFYLKSEWCISEYSTLKEKIKKVPILTSTKYRDSDFILSIKEYWHKEYLDRKKREEDMGNIDPDSYLNGKIESLKDISKTVDNLYELIESNPIFVDNVDYESLLIGIENEFEAILKIKDNYKELNNFNKSSENPFAHYFEAIYHKNNKNLEEARKSIDIAISHYIENPIFYLFKATVEEDSIVREKTINKAFDLKRKYSATIYNVKIDKGDYYFKEQQYTKAIELYNSVLNLMRENEESPKVKDISIKLGRAYYNSKKYIESIKIFKQILKKFPTDNELHYYLAMAYGKREDFTNFIYYIKQAKEYGNKRAEEIYNNVQSLRKESVD